MGCSLVAPGLDLYLHYSLYIQLLTKLWLILHVYNYLTHQCHTLSTHSLKRNIYTSKDSVWIKADDAYQVGKMHTMRRSVYGFILIDRTSKPCSTKTKNHISGAELYTQITLWGRGAQPFRITSCIMLFYEVWLPADLKILLVMFLFCFHTELSQLPHTCLTVFSYY